MIERRTIAPVIRTVTVNVPVERAFQVFTERIGSWWPLEIHAIFGEDAQTCVMETHEGGRIYEVSKDGKEAEWGVVTAIQPPQRVVWSWRPNPDRSVSTKVEIVFVPEGDGTRVELTHTGWELLGDDASEVRDSYDTGWPITLERFAAVTTGA